MRVVHASPDAGSVDVVPRGGEALVTGLTFPEASAYAEVPAGTYTLDVKAAGTNQTVLTVPDAALASGGVYSAFAVGTVYADSLNVCWCRTTEEELLRPVLPLALVVWRPPPRQAPLQAPQGAPPPAPR